MLGNDRAEFWSRFIWLHTTFYKSPQEDTDPQSSHLVWSGSKCLVGDTAPCRERGAQGTVSERLLGDRGRSGSVNEQRNRRCLPNWARHWANWEGQLQCGVWEDLEHRQTGAHGRQTFRLPVEIPLGGEEGRRLRREKDAPGQEWEHSPGQSLFSRAAAGLHSWTKTLSRQSK